MFANFFKNLIVSSFGNYIEVCQSILMPSPIQDFTSSDIVIDKWNGQVVKDNVAIKKTALESLGMSLFGAPIQVVNGYIKKLRIDIPWNKLLSKPCEMYLEDLHVVIRSNPSFDIDFARRMIWKRKKNLFNEMLDQIRVS
jgi:hypothetical protein